MKVLDKIDTQCGNGLGYTSWLVVDRYGVSDCLLIDKASDTPRVARCHPVIPATQKHADAFGVSVGTLICGVRWIETYNGQVTANP